MAGHDLVRRRECMTRDQVCVAMSGNVCRCTGYNGIVRAVQSAIDEGIQAETEGSEVETPATVRVRN